jgi:hypothetical protein
MLNQEISKMAGNPPVSDPNQVPNTLCDGQINVSVHAPLATITFTVNRPKPTQLFNGTVDLEAIVAARVTVTIPQAVSLRNLLEQVVKTQESNPSGAAASAGKAN